MATDLDSEKPRSMSHLGRNTDDLKKQERPATASTSSEDEDDGDGVSDDTSFRGRQSLSRITPAHSRASGLSRTVSEVRDGMLNQRDLEIGEENENNKNQHDNTDPNLVTWQGPDDPENPKNWLLNTKWVAVVIGTFHVKDLR